MSIEVLLEGSFNKQYVKYKNKIESYNLEFISNNIFGELKNQITKGDFTMDIILYILPVFLIVLLLPKYFMVLLAKCVDNALFREKIIDKEIRRKLYRNGVFADLIASFSMIVISFIQNIIESPSYYFTDLEDYFEYFNLNVFLFLNAPFYSTQSMFKGSFLFILVTIIISALISLFFDYFTIFRNPDLTKKQKICTLLIFVLMTAPYYFLISPTLFYN